MSQAVQLSSQSQVTQLYEENTNKRPVLTSQPNGLAPLGSTRPGLPLPDRQSSAPEPPNHCRQGSASSNKSTEGKPKPSSLSPEQAMKQFMSKMSSLEHHEVFSYPEGEWIDTPTGTKSITPWYRPPVTALCLHPHSVFRRPKCEEEVRGPGRSQQRRLR